MIECKCCGNTIQSKPIAETDGSNDLKDIFYLCECGCLVKETWQKIDVEFQYIKRKISH